jgi:hypothetical protein
MDVRDRQASIAQGMLEWLEQCRPKRAAAGEL